MVEIRIEENSGNYKVKVYRNFVPIKEISTNPVSGLPLTKEEALLIKSELENEYKDKDIYSDELDKLIRLIEKHVLRYYPLSKQMSDLSDWITYIPLMKKLGYPDIETLLVDYIKEILYLNKSKQDILYLYDRDIEVDIDESYTLEFNNLQSEILLQSNIVQGSLRITIRLNDNSELNYYDNQGNILNTQTGSNIGIVDYRTGSINIYAQFDNVSSVKIEYATWLILNLQFIIEQLLKVALRQYFVQKCKRLYYKYKNELSNIENIEEVIEREVSDLSKILTVI